MGPPIHLRLEEARELVMIEEAKEVAMIAVATVARDDQGETRRT
jgi:hypothetical protein